MPPAYVKPHVKRQKNDMADAEAICDAVTRANMRFVSTKTPEQQSCLMLARRRLIANAAIRGYAKTHRKAARSACDRSGGRPLFDAVDKSQRAQQLDRAT
jgi:transposase